MNQFRPITIIDSPRYEAHDTGNEHPETPERSRVIRERLKNSLLAPRLTVASPRPAPREWLTTIHDEAYLFRFEESALAGRTYMGHPDNQLCFESYDIAVLAAGGGLAGIDLIENNEADLLFCAVRPPGHHAERSCALGFCFLNNVALAANYWRRHYHKDRIFILDFDAHHGNGIQAAFEDEPAIFYASLHEHPTYSFPGTGYAEETGVEAGKGTTLNIPLPPGADDAMVMQAVEERIGPALTQFRPEAIIVAAGFDGHGLDDMSGLNYSTILYGRLGARIKAWADEFCRGKALSILEGGYHLESLAAGVEAYLAGLAHQRDVSAP